MASLLLLACPENHGPKYDQGDDHDDEQFANHEL